MANWTVKLTAGTIDASGQNPNIMLTLVATNSVTNEVQTRSMAAQTWTVNTVKAAGEEIIRQLNVRDAAVIVVNAALAGGPVTLATG